jgi:hypothetical protein
MRLKNLKLIFRIQGEQRFKSRYTGMTMAELMKRIWKIDLSVGLKPAAETSRILIYPRLEAGGFPTEIKLWQLNIFNETV